MSQLFNDQSRDAWRAAGRRGLLLLWLRVVPDLIKTSFLEHLSNLKRRNIMTSKLIAGARSPGAVPTAFFVVFVTVFLLVLGGSAISTFIMPETYASKARIKIDRIVANATDSNKPQPAPGIYDPYFSQTEIEVMQSEIILDKVVDALDLNEVFRKKYAYVGKFKTSESRAALRRMIELRPVRNTSLVEITVYSGDRVEAAKIANAIAQIYRSYRNDQRKLMVQAIHEVEFERAAKGLAVVGESEEARIADIIAEVNRRTCGLVAVNIVESAEPAPRPVRPNVPLNLFFGGVMAALLGMGAGGIAAFIVAKLKKRLDKAPAVG